MTAGYQGLVTKWQTRLNFLQSLRPEDRLVGDYTEEETLINCIKAVAEVIARNVQPSPDWEKLSPGSIEYLALVCERESAVYLQNSEECRKAGHFVSARNDEVGSLACIRIAKIIRDFKRCAHRLSNGNRCDKPIHEGDTHVYSMPKLYEARPIQQPAQIIAAQQAEDEGLWCIPQTVMEAHLQKELRRLTEAVEGKTSAECLRELLLKSHVQQPATEPELKQKCGCCGCPWQKCIHDDCSECHGKWAQARAALALRDVPQEPNNQEEFEKYAKQHRLDIRPSEWQQSDWTYADADVESHWQCWLAARQVPVGPEGEK